MSTQSLAELALRLDPAFVRFHDGERGLGTKIDNMLQKDPGRRNLRRAIENLGTSQAFVQIMNVRSDPEYRALLDEILDGLLPHLPPRDRRLLNRDAAAFLASPGSTTPFHLDHEQNFLCHIRGKKTFYVWDHRDRSIVSEPALEEFFHQRRIRNLQYRPEMQAKAHMFQVEPGDTVYMPMGSPHAVSTGNEVTVTFSVLMNTRSSCDTVETYQANFLLRRLGLAPGPVGTSSVRDWLKRTALNDARFLRDLARGRRPERRVEWY
ncbi:MAG TPA: cupin-like domain-containing protein [Kofleriaceae bacterium]|nr:cupin-like domain-containing protein [Kofleriaceae bacterium]